MVIRPVTDLRNHFPDVERDLKKNGELYLTKNGYGSAVMLSIEEYARLKGSVAFEERPIERPAKSSRGAFRKYADPDKIAFEKNAGREYVRSRIAKYVPEVSSDE